MSSSFAGNWKTFLVIRQINHASLVLPYAGAPAVTRAVHRSDSPEGGHCSTAREDVRRALSNEFYAFRDHTGRLARVTVQLVEA